MSADFSPSQPPQTREVAIRLADYVAAVCDGLAAGTTTADQARRGLAVEHGIFWDRLNACDEIGYMRAVHDAMSPDSYKTQMSPGGDRVASQPPQETVQTFEAFDSEPWPASIRNPGDIRRYCWQAGKAAGVASQQAEIERLKVDYEERSERWANTLRDLRAENAELEAVVEAARDVLDQTGFTLAPGDMRADFLESFSRLRAALSALEKKP